MPKKKRTKPQTPKIPRLKLPNIKSLIFGKLSTSPTVSNPDSFLPVADIRGGIIVTSDNRYIKVIEVLPVNFYLKSAAEQRNIVYYFSSYLKIAPSNLQIIVQTGKANTEMYRQNMMKLHDNEPNENCREMIFENIGLVDYLSVNEAVTRRFFIAFSRCDRCGHDGISNSFEDIRQSLSDHAANAAAYLDYCGLEIVRHEDEDRFLTEMLGSYFESDIFNKDIPLSERLSPLNIDISGKDYIVIDGVYYSYLYIPGYGYNVQNSLAWLAPFVEAGDGVSFSFTLEKERKDKILPKIAKTTMLNRSRLRGVSDTRTDFE